MSVTVSIVMPSFNSEKYIEDAITSVCLQTFEEWELLLVDDASDDRTISLAQRTLLSYGHSQRARLFSNPKRCGPAFSRNRAIREARGRWIAFLDSDDLWTPNKLEMQLPMFDKPEVRLVCGGYSVVDGDGKEIGTRYVPPLQANYTDMLYLNTVGCLTAIYDSERTGKVTMPPLPSRQDYALWLDLIRPHGLVHGLPCLVGKYRIHGNSVSSNKLAAVYWQYHLYRSYENLPVLKSLYCLWNHLIKKRTKYSLS